LPPSTVTTLPAMKLDSSTGKDGVIELWEYVEQLEVAGKAKSK
jgi:hypothetical protein